MGCVLSSLQKHKLSTGKWKLMPEPLSVLTCKIIVKERHIATQVPEKAAQHAKKLYRNLWKWHCDLSSNNNFSCNSLDLYMIKMTSGQNEFIYHKLTARSKRLWIKNQHTLQSAMESCTVASTENEVRGAQHKFFPLLPCPGFLFGSKTVLICLHELVSGEIDENLIHVFLR